MCNRCETKVQWSCQTSQQEVFSSSSRSDNMACIAPPRSKIGVCKIHIPLLQHTALHTSSSASACSSLRTAVPRNHYSYLSSNCLALYSSRATDASLAALSATTLAACWDEATLQQAARKLWPGCQPPAPQAASRPSGSRACAEWARSRRKPCCGHSPAWSMRAASAPPAKPPLVCQPACTLVATTCTRQQAVHELV